MCGRLGRPDLPWSQIYASLREFLDGMELLRDPDAADLAPSWNVAPTQLLDIAYIDEGHLFSSTARWWFIPGWFKDPPEAWKQTTFNARIETAAQKPTFRAAWAHHRCIVPALGYYEWLGEEGAKRPFWITTRRNTPVLFFAGLYSRRPEGHTCAILTRPALAQIDHIHDRTPVILSDDELLPWLRTDPGLVPETLGNGWEGRMLYHEVAPLRRGEDGEELIEAI